MMDTLETHNTMSVDAETNTEKIIRRAGRPRKILTPEELGEKNRPKTIGRPRKEKPEKISRPVGRPRKVLTSEEIERKQNPKSRGRPKIYEDGTIRKPLDPDYFKKYYQNVTKVKRDTQRLVPEETTTVIDV